MIRRGGALAIVVLSLLPLATAGSGPSPRRAAAPERPGGATAEASSADAPAEAYQERWSYQRIGAPAVWDKGFDGFGQTVAVIDYGVDTDHPDLKGRVIEEACFAADGSCGADGGDTESFGPRSALACTYHAECFHGTHVAAIVAAVAPKAKLIVANVFHEESGKPASTMADQIRALEWVYSLRSRYSIAAVNLSLGLRDFTAPCDDVDDPSLGVPAYRKAVANLRAAGIPTVAASGNDGYVNAMNFPACLSSVVSVGNTGLDATGADAVFRQSNSAAFLSLLAPGTEVLAAVPGGHRERHSGTSMAAPHVAASFALLRHARPGLAVDEALAALVSTGRPVTDDRDPHGVTKPRVDLWNALQSVSSGPGGAETAAR